MIFKLYHSTTLSGTKTDISGSVFKVTGYGWSRKIDYAIEIPHPTFEIDIDVSLSVGDYLFFEEDSNIRLVVYIDHIEYLDKSDTNSVKTWDIIYKLKKTMIREIHRNWFDESDYWNGLSSSEQYERYKYYGNGSAYVEEHYISALFLLQAMFYKCTGWEMTDTQITGVYNSSSIFKGDYSSTEHVLSKGRLLFQWEQLKYVKLSKSTDGIWQGATCLDLFLEIMQKLELKFEYMTYITETRWRLLNYTTPNVPTADDDGYKSKDIEPYDGVSVSLSKLASLTDYYVSFTELVDTEINSPDVAIEDKKYKNYTLINSFELHYRRSSTYYLDEMGEGGYDTFLEQYAAYLEVLWTKTYKEKTLTMEAFEERNALEIKYNFEAELVDITYLVEII